MYRVLVAGDSLLFTHTSHPKHGAFRCEIARAATGALALRLAKEIKPHVAVIAIQLPDMSGLDLLHAMSRGHSAPPRIILSGVTTCRCVVEAMRLGAADCIDAPVTEDKFLCSIGDVIASLSEATNASAIHVEPHSLRRWANIVTQVVPLNADPRTLREWSRAVAVSVGALRNWCRTAGLSARRSLMFARILRATIKHQSLEDTTRESA